MMGWSVAAVLALVVGWLVLRPVPTSLAPVPVQFKLDFTGDGLRSGGILVSPDGSLFALTTFDGIHIRPAGEASYRLLPNTERAISPAFSPDSQWLVFVREGVLVKVAVDGSGEQILVRSNTLIASTPNWGYPGTVVFQSQDRLYRVSDAGGEPEVIDGGVNVRRPSMLPNGSGVLYGTTGGIMLLAFGADTARLVVPGGADATYVETGHLVYGHQLQGGLFAVPFDLASHTVIGNPVPVRDDVDVQAANAFYSISRTGTLIYTTNPLDAGQASHFLLLDMRGGIDTIPLSPRVFNWPRFSPDGERLAFNTGAGRIEQRRVYTYDLSSGATTPITIGGGAHAAAWSPDGTLMVFSSEQAGTIAEDLFIAPIDGSSPPTRLLNLPSDDHAMAWPSEDIIVINAAGAQDILIVDPNSPERVTPYLAAEWRETELSVSPDGALAAYESHEVGRPQVYVRSFPDAREVRLVSVAGGISPRWAPDGQTVYYWSLTRDTLFAAAMGSGQGAGASPEVVAVLPRLLPGWDVNPVSGQAVVGQAVEANAVIAAEIVVVVNWFEELKERMGN
jgi:Tol biopolymer transport system component